MIKHIAPRGSALGIGLLFLLVLITISCDGLSSFIEIGTSDKIEVTGIEISPSEYTLSNGDTYQIFVTITPDNASDQSISWSSSDKNIASVDSNGLVMALAEGEVSIVVESVSNSEASDTALITVIEDSSTTYIITFDSLGGSSINVQYVDDQNFVIEPEDPEKEGYTFEGWYSDEDSSTLWDFTVDTVTEDLILYAKWSEIFLTADKPDFDVLTYTEDTSKTYSLMKPWNYGKTYNSEREYPIVIALHGSLPSTYTSYYYTPFIANDEEEMKDYPCFFLAPNNTNLGWDTNAAWVRNIIEELIQNYRINTDRIYIVGFSMGGSGSYDFAEKLYSEKGLITAGIVRSAGMSNYDLPNEIAQKISIWYHVGLSDSDDIISIANQSYSFMKNLSCYSGATETLYDETVYDYSCKKSALTLDSIDFMILSKYEELGHSDDPVRNDPEILSWLFKQSLANR